MSNTHQFLGRRFPHFLTALTESSTCAPKLIDISREAKEEWAAMSKQERIEATQDVLDEMNTERTERKFTAHNTTIGAFHDTRATLDRICDEVCYILIVW